MKTKYLRKCKLCLATCCAPSNLSGRLDAFLGAAIRSFLTRLAVAFAVALACTVSHVFLLILEQTRLSQQSSACRQDCLRSEQTGVSRPVKRVDTKDKPGFQPGALLDLQSDC
jgi:hypothetical protein